MNLTEPMRQVVLRSIYAIAWHFLQLENWVIVLAVAGIIAGSITFYATVKNGHI